MTTFSLFSKPIVTPGLFEAGQSIFAYSRHSNALPDWLSDAFLTRVSDNEKAIHNQALTNNDDVTVYLRPSAVMTNVSGYVYCNPTWRELWIQLRLFILAIMLFSASFVACYLTYLLVVSDEHLFSKIVAVIGVLYAFIAVTPILWNTRETSFNIMRLIGGKGTVDAEEDFLMIGNQVSAITGKGLIHSPATETFIPTLIPWSEVGAVKLEGSSVFILDHQGDEIACLFHPTTESMTSSDVLDLIRDNITVR